MKSRKLLKRADFVLAAVLLAAALIVSVLYYRGRGEAKVAVVSVNGMEIARYSLNDAGRIEERIEGYGGGYNLLIVENGTARLIEADCPDHLCVKQGSVKRNGETIVCLPHRVVVEIKGGEEYDFDAIVN